MPESPAAMTVEQAREKARGVFYDHVGSSVWRLPSDPLAALDRLIRLERAEAARDECARQDCIECREELEAAIKEIADA